VTTAERHDNEPKTRRERLAAIGAEYTEEIHEPRTRSQLGGAEPVSRFAAVTSEGSMESSHAYNGNLIVADTPAELAECLRQEAGEGWLAHGRAWDLDVPWEVWGNLPVAYRVQVGEEGREDGIYLFDDLVDAEAFQKIVRHWGGEADLTEKPVHDNHASDRLIDAERARH
jgi:hypothetical protein